MKKIIGKKWLKKLHFQLFVIFLQMLFAVIQRSDPQTFTEETEEVGNIAKTALFRNHVDRFERGTEQKAGIVDPDGIEQVQQILSGLFFDHVQGTAFAQRESFADDFQTFAGIPVVAADQITDKIVSRRVMQIGYNSIPEWINKLLQSGGQLSKTFQNNSFLLR